MMSGNLYLENYSSDDDEEEPKLKYERLGGDLPKILEKEFASTVCVNSKLLVLGTNWGKLHIFDHQGNRIRQFCNHSTPVVMIDMDSNGDYIISCSHDRRVIIQELYSNDNNTYIDVDSPVRCVAIDPSYGRARSAKRFIIGSNQVIMYEKGIFNSLKPFVLSEGLRSSGEVARNVKWGDEFIAWASDTSVKVHHAEKRSIISFVTRTHSLALGCDQYPPHICWKNERVFLIGWGDSVKVCQIRERTTKDSPDNMELPPFIVEIVHMFTTDFYVCGISFMDHLLVLLGYNKSFGEEGMSSSNEQEWRRPQMRVVVPHQGSYDELSKDVLSLRNYQENISKNYHLGNLVEERQFYIVSPQDFVIAKPTEPVDRIKWLLKRQKFQEALEIAEECGGKVEQFTTANIGQTFIKHLLDNGYFEEAADLTPRVLGNDKLLWEQMILRFMELKQIKALSSHIPTGKCGPFLNSSLYQAILLELLKNEHEAFLSLVKEWPNTLYSSELVISNVLEILTQNTNNLVLLRSLAHLYSNIGKHDKALAIYLKLKHTDIFSLIERHSLYSCVPRHIAELMSLDVDTCLQMCSNHISSILPTNIVSSLINRDKFLYKYLDMLYENHRDLSAPFHNKLVLLYAIYEPIKILPLLRASTFIDLHAALRITSKYNLSIEKVHLLIRMGNLEAAIHHVLGNEDIHWAIQICKDHADPDLWQIVIDYSITKPEYIRILLNSVGAHMDPVLIVKNIPYNLKIEGLRDALTKILHDYQLKVSLQASCQKVLVSDNIQLLKKLVSCRSAGLRIDGDSDCAGCNQPVSDIQNRQNIVIFGCRHVYHRPCLIELDTDMETCVVCRSTKKLIPGS